MTEEERIAAKKAQIETLKKVIDQVGGGGADDSEDEDSSDEESSSSSSDSSEEEEEEENSENDDAITLSSSEDGMSKIIHAVAAAKKLEKSGEKSDDKSGPNFIVTLDGIDKNYFDASADGLISESHEPGILKLKKHPDAGNQTVYIKTGRGAVNLDTDRNNVKQPSFTVTDNNQKGDSSQQSKSDRKSQQPSDRKSPGGGVKTLEERRENLNRVAGSSAGSAEKPKAMVAPIRNSANTISKSSSSHVSPESGDGSSIKSQRKRILPPDGSPDPRHSSSSSSRHETPHYPSSEPPTYRPPSSHSSHPSRPSHPIALPPSHKSGGGNQVCRYWPDCSKGSACTFYHPSSDGRHHQYSSSRHHNPHHESRTSSSSGDSRRRSVTLLG